MAASGIGLGMLVSSALVQIGWHPRVLPYAVLLALFAIALAGADWMPEPVLERKRFHLRLERPSVPAVVRRPFTLAASALAAAAVVAFEAWRTQPRRMLVRQEVAHAEA